MKKILSLVLTIAIVFSSFSLFQTAPKVEAATEPASAAVGGVENSDPLKMVVYNDGSLGLYFWTGTFYQNEYYMYNSQTSWGTNLFFTDDTTGITSQYVSPCYKPYYVPDAPSLGYGDLTQSGNTVTCTWFLDGGKMKFEQIVQYTSGNYAVDITFRLTNLSTDTAYSNAKVIHGGDTLFGGEDNATSYYNTSNGMVYVKNPDMTKSGIMGFAGYASSPASAYFAGQYGIGNWQATAGQLLSTADATEQDAGYQLQWNQGGSLAPGQSWEIKSYTTVTEPGAIQVISPSQQSAVQGAAVDYTFYVQNFSTDSQSIAMAASSEHGWPTTLVSATPVTVAGSGGSAAVVVRVQVPADAGGVSNDIVTLTATGSKAASGTVTTNVMYSPTVSVSASPNSVMVGSAAVLTADITGGGSPTGTVTFFNDGTSIGSADVSNGTASLSYTPASAGNLPITASYSGDAHNAAATSSDTSLTVTKKQPVLTLSASPDSPAEYPTDITLTVTLSDYYGSLSGKTVVITLAGTLFSLTTDESGAASSTFSLPLVGTSYPISASFAGDANHLAASSSTINFVYNKGTQPTPGISLWNGNAAITYGDSLLYYYALGSGGDGYGAYEYRSDNTSVLSINSVTGRIAVNGAGNAKIYVKRLGDPYYNTSAESFVQITVAAKPITVINAGVMDKIYDGTTDASFSGTPVLSGVVSGDVVTLTNGTPTFAGKNYSSSPVTVNFTTAFSIGGTDADNYTLMQPDSVTASIGKRPLAVSVNPVTINCGQALPVLGVTVDAADFVSGETESSLVGFAGPAASHTYGSTTELANNKDFTVTYSGGSATDNYYFTYNNTAKITIHPVYIMDGDYQVTGSYGVSPSPADWNKEDIVVTPANGYDKISLTGDVWTDSITVSEEALNGQAAFKLKKSTDAGADGTQTEFTSIYYNLDKKAPTGEITIKENTFRTFINGITFGLFYKETLDVTITGADTLGNVSSGVSTIEYQKVAAEKADPFSGTWTTYAPLNVSPDDKFIIYARITDNAGNVIVINSSGTIVDATKPVITMNYPEDNIWTIDPDAQISVNVTDALSGVDTVTYTVGGAAAVTASPSFVIDGLEDGIYYVAVTAADKSGNEQTEIVTVKKDAADPTITAGGDTASYLKSDTIDVAAAAGVSGIAAVTVQKFGETPVDITSTYEADGYEVNANGTYIFTVTNNAGVSETDEIIYNRIDRVQPVISINSNGYTEGTWTNTPSVTLDVTNIASNLGTTTFEVSMDGIYFESFNGTFVISSDSSGTYSFRARSASGMVSDVKTFEVKMDHAAPTGRISIAANDFTAFLNTITFNLFFKETTDVSIFGEDAANQTTNSGLAKIEYQKIAAVTDYDVNGIWIEDDEFPVSPDEKFIIYARITDNAGNVTIINSDGTVVYTSSALSRTSVMFDVDESRSAYADVRIALTPDTNTLKQIAFGEEVLIKDTDYTVDGNVVTIMKEYLKTVVSGTISLTFTFNPLGENYVYGDGPATAQLAVTQIVHAQAPVFTTNLSGTKTYSKNEAAGLLQVQAEVDDGGKITYQWYVSSTASAAGTALSGATSASCTPKTDVTGAFYYYVTAVNTNDGASGDREADTVSGTFKVIVTNVELLPPEIGEGAPSATLPGDAKEVLKSVLTAADIQKSAEGSNISIRLKITKKDVSQADRDAAALVLGNNTLAEFLDISLVKSIDGIESAVTQTASPIRITMQIPEDMRKDGRVFAIIRIHNGAAEVLSDLDTDSATFTFETDCFSTYAPVYKDAAAAVGAAKTGETPPAVSYYLIGAGLLLAAFYLGKKRRERMKEETAD